MSTRRGAEHERADHDGCRHGAIGPCLGANERPHAVSKRSRAFIRPDWNENHVRSSAGKGITARDRRSTHSSAALQKRRGASVGVHRSRRSVSPVAEPRCVWFRHEVGRVRWSAVAPLREERCSLVAGAGCCGGEKQNTLGRLQRGNWGQSRIEAFERNSSLTPISDRAQFRNPPGCFEKPGEGVTRSSAGPANSERRWSRSAMPYRLVVTSITPLGCPEPHFSWASDAVK